MAMDWSQEEVEATVADYFAMLEAELKGVPYDKTGHRRRLARLLNGRSDGSIEFKHQNISAVLDRLGFFWIDGYKPRYNFQRLLLDVVSQRLNSNRYLLELAEEDVERLVAVPPVDDILRALTTPPKPSPVTNGIRETTTAYLPFRFDYLEREAHNRKLGLAGEEFVINFERARLISLGRGNLASKIKHISKVKGDAAGFDVLSFEESGAEKLIEVKTTKHGRETPFFVSRNELAVSRIQAERYHLYRVFRFRESPGLFTLHGALSSTCTLDPSTYVATVA